MKKLVAVFALLLCASFADARNITKIKVVNRGRVAVVAPVVQPVGFVGVGVQTGFGFTPSFGATTFGGVSSFSSFNSFSTGGAFTQVDGFGRVVVMDQFGRVIGVR